MERVKGREKERRKGGGQAGKGKKLEMGRRRQEERVVSIHLF